jgi:hypothetical protein
MLRLCAAKNISETSLLTLFILVYLLLTLAIGSLLWPDDSGLMFALEKERRERMDAEVVVETCTVNTSSRSKGI